ncbi:hypothetical protein [Actinotalea sp. K2]|uniref:hypothetical protein n=1 Tax=Actinotalea sp. K2 TaxID=2939438 RepID=UPI002017233C|nr:hypothetical protein [Actinotalea sp. K2]MCL3861530.1 hypothetical protein [Actinotalea sp. K2]
MELARNLALVLHLVGMASIFGAFLVQAKAPRKKVDAAMVHGALTALVTGLALVGLAEARDADVNHVKVGVKLVVLLVIGVLVWRRRKADAISTGEWGAIGGLTLTNIVLAVFW